MEPAHPMPVQPARPTRVVALNRLSTYGYELVLERNSLIFQAGQLIHLHGRTRLEDRSYTVCSGTGDEHLTVLFRHIPRGVLTPQLVVLKPGDVIGVSGPYGEFVLRDPRRPAVFIATGTGIAPGRAYLRSHPDLKLVILHGVRRSEDLYYRHEFCRLDYHPCVSAEPEAEGVFHGRVTDLAHTCVFPPGCHYYLCGANEMIYEMREWLKQAGVDRASIFSEEYYYRSDDA